MLLGKAFSHPCKFGILRLLTEREPISPREVADVTGVALGTVAYHFRQLASVGVVEPASERPRRGAIEHLYRLSPAGRRVAALLEPQAAEAIDRGARETPAQTGG